MNPTAEKIELAEAVINKAYAAIKRGETTAAIMYLCKSTKVYASTTNDIMKLYRKAVQTPSDN